MKPYFEISRKIVLKQYRKLTSISDSVAYSSKTNPQITPILEEHTDALFSVHVMNELRHINDMSRVMFLPQAWKKDDVSELLKKGVTQFVMDNEQDLDILLHTIKE
ncbi:MAG: decarboxylase, partial [Nanoarchaeota archaeon]